MSVKINTTVIGLAELEKAVKELTEEVYSKTGRRTNLTKAALNTVAKDVEKRMVAGAPEGEEGTPIDWHKSKNGKWVASGIQRADPGRLKRSIFRKSPRRPKYLSEAVFVGPRFGKSRNDPNGAWYAAIVEFQGGKGGRGKGYMRNSIIPAHHTEMFASELGRAIERVAKRIGNANAQAIGAKYRK